MSSKKLHLAVSTHIQQKTLFPRRILAYSDFLGQTSVVGLEAIKGGDKIFGNNLEKQAEKDTYEKYSQ